MPAYYLPSRYSTLTRVAKSRYALSVCPLTNSGLSAGATAFLLYEIIIIDNDNNIVVFST